MNSVNNFSEAILKKVNITKGKRQKTVKRNANENIRGLITGDEKRLRL